MKILFISRAYPPIVGGIENQNYELSVWLGKITQMSLIINRYGKKFLPIFFPWAIILAIFKTRKVDIVLLGDGVLGLVGWLIKKCYPKKPVISIVHGLDLTFKNPIYQNFWVSYFIKNLDGLIAVGNETIDEGVRRGLSKNLFNFIPNGVDTKKHVEKYSTKDLEEILGEKVNQRRIILTSGRLAKRKGVAWFIREVMPQLNENILYVVAGDGPDKENILSAIQEKNLFSRVKLLGYVSDRNRNVLFNTAEVFIQPNIAVPGDMEGFGISVLEAGSCRLPVIASRLEGLKDAIIDNENGFLVESRDAEGFKNKINALLSDDTQRQAFGERARQYIVSHFEWQIIAQKYKEILEKYIQ